MQNSNNKAQFTVGNVYELTWSHGSSLTVPQMTCIKKTEKRATFKDKHGKIITRAITSWDHTESVKGYDQYSYIYAYNIVK